jgi:hypothetical protein
VSRAAGSPPSSAAPAAEAPRWCADFAAVAGEDPIGMAGHSFDHYLFVERPLPWPEDEWQPATLPPHLAGIDRCVARLTAHARAAPPGRRVRLLAVAPDGAYSRPGHTRLLAFSRPPGPFAEYRREAFLVPHAAAVAGQLKGECGRAEPGRPGRHRTTQYRVSGLRLVAGRAPGARGE